MFKSRAANTQTSFSSKRSLLTALWLFIFMMSSCESVFAKDWFGEETIFTPAKEDTLPELGRRFGFGYVEIRAANPTLDPWSMGENARVILPGRHILPDGPRQGILINIADMRLYYFGNPDSPQSWPIGIGREGLSTPLGTTTIVRKMAGPSWNPTDRMLREDATLRASYGPGEDNPLGTHMLYLGWPTYGIHGTNKPLGVGRRLSSGCIRMYPENIITVFNLVPVGTSVTVVDQAIKLGFIDGNLYIEAHPSRSQVDKIELREATIPEIPDGIIERIKVRAGADKGNIDWAAVRRALLERRGIPVKISSAGMDKAAR